MKRFAVLLAATLALTACVTDAERARLAQKELVGRAQEGLRECLPEKARMDGDTLYAIRREYTPQNSSLLRFGGVVPIFPSFIDPNRDESETRFCEAALRFQNGRLAELQYRGDRWDSQGWLTVCYRLLQPCL